MFFVQCKNTTLKILVGEWDFYQEETEASPNKNPTSRGFLSYHVTYVLRARLHCHGIFKHLAINDKFGTKTEFISGNLENGTSPPSTPYQS